MPRWTCLCLGPWRDSGIRGAAWHRRRRGFGPSDGAGTRAPGRGDSAGALPPRGIDGAPRSERSYVREVVALHHQFGGEPFDPDDPALKPRALPAAQDACEQFDRRTVLSAFTMRESPDPVIDLVNESVEDELLLGRDPGRRGESVAAEEAVRLVVSLAIL